MARRKQEPCEYCEGDMYSESDTGCNLYLELYPGKHISAITYARNPNTEELEEICLQIPCKYCPNCGRKLMEY